MKFYIKNKKVSKKAAKDFVDKLWGEVKFEARIKEAYEYFSEEEDNYCSFADGFAIEY